MLTSDWLIVKTLTSDWSSGILELMGKNKKVILVGNKFDLLVPDSRNYYKRVTTLLRTQFLDKCWSQSTQNSVFPQIIGTCCISGRLSSDWLIILHY